MMQRSWARLQPTVHPNHPDPAQPSDWRGHNVQMRAPTRADVRHWVTGYEAAWRAPGTDALRSLFTDDALYRHSPYAEPISGLDAIAQMWEAEREGPDEVFTLETDVVAVEGDTAVVRARVHYGDPVRQEYFDLWVIRFEDDHRCVSFEEWPFWPEKPWSGRE
jgi:ketosteroid isomerase-like protein